MTNGWIMDGLMNEVVERVVNSDTERWLSPGELRDLLAMICEVHSEGIGGAILEMGCAQGLTTTYFRKLLNALSSGRELHVCDSFEGLPEKRPEDGFDGSTFQGMFAMGRQVVLGNFSIRGLEQPIIHQGWFDEISDYPSPIAFVFLDADFYESIRTGLQAVWPLMSPGGMIAIHDYDAANFPGVRAAVLGFSMEQGVGVCRSSSGFPFVRKPRMS